MEFYFINLAIPVVRIIIFLLGFLLVLRFVLKIQITKPVYSVVVLVVCAQVLISLSATHGPRFTLSGESGSAPVVEGEVKDASPDGLTDSERLQMNRDLYNDNLTLVPQ